MRASRYTHEHAVIHRRAAVLVADNLSTVDRAVVGSIPRPARVRGVEPARRDRPARHESKYGLRGFGPTNKSGRAKS